MSKDTIIKFEDMPVWQESQNLAVDIYRLTHEFPKNEQYGLTSQIQRAAISISANIAEGFGRQSNKDKSHFYHIALGSLLETKNFIYLSHRLDYLKKTDADIIIAEIESVHRQIAAILKYFKDNA